MARTTRKKTSPNRTSSKSASSGQADNGEEIPPLWPPEPPLPRSEAARLAYPEVLKDKEDQLLRQRPAGDTDRAHLVGFALSGGGIRSATFCLGVFQGLAKLRLLKSIDYLSTVSGGGYFGSFYGRLFSRDEVKGVEYVEAILDPEHEDHRKTPMKNLGGGKVMQWLRDNGRHLSPNGAGDLLLGLAIMLRNWVAIQVVMMTALLTLCLALQSVRSVIEWGLLKAGMSGRVLGWLGHLSSAIWWSPYVYLAIVLFVLTLIPMWAYWMVRSVPQQNEGKGPRSWLHCMLTDPRTGLWFTVGIAAAVFLWYGRYPLPFTECSQQVCPSGPGLLTVGSASLLVMALALLTLGLTKLTACFAGRGDRPTRACVREQRHELSVLLKGCLVVTAAVIVFCLIDSFGQTAYLLMTGPDVYVRTWLAGAAGTAGSLFAFAAGARKFAVSFGGSPGGQRLHLSLSLVSTIAALVLLLVILLSVDTVSHAIAWEFKTPAPDTPGLPTKVLQPAARSLTKSDVHYQEAGSTAELRIEATISTSPDQKGMPTYARQLNTFLLFATIVTLLLTFLFGRTWQFLNNSSLYSLYTARLIRAYLGASNPRRIEKWVTVTETLPEDDASMADYWRSGHGMREDKEGTTSSPVVPAIAKGAPLHIVNTTLNETLSGRSQIEQRDRKGMGFAFGPAGVSAGVTHHAVVDWDKKQRTAELLPGGEKRFRVFDYGSNGDAPVARETGDKPDQPEVPVEGAYKGEDLTLGDITGISGAAFSTGLGARTHMGLSFLAAFFNVRIGYWWDSGIEPKQRFRNPSTKKGSSSGDMFTRCFPVVSYLIDEALARFHGPLRQRWYLSDGGHFENMGGYELIRRRLPLMVVVDAECDTDYRYEGLSNLVRHARLDFGAEIRFLTRKELVNTLDEEVHPYFGTLQMVRRGSWENEQVPSEKPQSSHRFKLKEPVRAQYSLAYAALAHVEYADEAPEQHRWLLYLKPALINKEPQDVLQYHTENPDFPQQTTADQFFDEAQWESYRKLGEHIASRVFGDWKKKEDKKILPRDWLL
ncbi:MAG: hypothetical protein WB783_05065 [Arenicellales bacterium]